MAHVRTQIRNALATRLTGLTTTGGNVYKDRKEMVPDASLPALLIMNDAEQVVNRGAGSQAANHPRPEERTLSIKVQALAKGVTALDDTLDEMCLEVEKAITADIFMGGLTVDARLAHTSYELDATGEKPAGSADMLWEFDYWVLNTAPDVVI